MADASFKNGKKHNPDGTVCTIVKIKETLSSNGNTKYTTTLWSDNTYSCNCPGWAMHKRGGERKCKHTKASAACNGADMVTPGSQHNANLAAARSPLTPPPPRRVAIR